MTGSQHITFLARVVAAALIGALIGLLDFFLFELQGNLTVFREYVLYKPSLFGLSLLSFQLLSFTALGILSFVLFSSVWWILRKLVHKRGTLPLLLLSSATLALCMISLRVVSLLRVASPDNRLHLAARILLILSDANWGQACGVVILIVGSALLVFWASVLERFRVRPSGWSGSGLSLSPRSQFLLLSLLTVVSFFSPDIYSCYLRFPYNSEKEHPKAPNVLLVVLDTVRADHLSCYGYGRLTTPNIDRISRQGVLFLNAFSPSPWTLPSHASMFTGLYPSQHQADWGHTYLHESFPTLAERLRDLGYQTVGFSENAYVGRCLGFGLDRGFAAFLDTWRRPLVVRAIGKVATQVFHYKERLEYAERSIGLLERWLSNNHNRGKPFFAFVNLMAAHNPRYPRSALGSGTWTQERLATEPVNLISERYYLPHFRLTQQELAITVDLYDSDISYLDAQIGNLFSFLEKTGSLDETIVILTSDHGENFGEHGLLGHQFCLYNTLLRVPLILRYPALLKPERIEKRVSTVFLFRALATLVGDPVGDGSDRRGSNACGQLQSQDLIVGEYSNGIDHLRGVVGDESVGLDFSMFDRNLKCIIQGDYKFIWASNGKHELYQIVTDPAELENLIEEEPDRARALHQLLNSWELSTPKKLVF